MHNLVFVSMQLPLIASPLITIIYATCLLSKDTTNISAYCEGKQDLMSITFLRCVTSSSGKMEVKAMLHLVAHIPS